MPEFNVLTQRKKDRHFWKKTKAILKIILLLIKIVRKFLDLFC